MRKRRLSEEDCSKRPQKRKSTVNMLGWLWSNKEDASTSQGKLKFRRSGDESRHPLATEFIKQLTEKIPGLIEVSAQEEKEDIFLVFSQKGNNENLSETKPTVRVVLRDIYPEDSELDTSSSSSSSSQGKNTLTVNFWSQEGINIPDLDKVSEWIKHKQVIPNPQEEQHVARPGEVRFLRCVSGNTLGSDDGFIGKLEEEIPGLKEEYNKEKCDVILAFCPVVSRAGTDIESALKKLHDLPESKPAVLVVLHHTFNPELIVPDSSRSVNRENTLTVDCLFHEDRGLLQCQKTLEALEKVIHWIKPLEKSQSLYQWIYCGIRLGTILGMIPGSSYFLTGPDTQQEKRNPELREANDLKADNDKLHTLLQDFHKTLSSIKNNTNPNHLEDEQHANLMKHLREIEEELKGKSEEVENTEENLPTNNEMLSSPPTLNMSEGPPNDPTNDFFIVEVDDKES